MLAADDGVTYLSSIVVHLVDGYSGVHDGRLNDLTLHDRLNSLVHMVMYMFA